MKKIKYILATVLFFSSVAVGQPFSPNATYETCFSPTPLGQESCTHMIVNAINTAQKSILVQAYSFTSAPIAWALVQAHRRGVDVKVILDKSQRKARYSSSQFLINQGIPVWIDYRVAIAHNKVIIIDQRAVILGSFNFTKAAEQKNAENSNLINDSQFAKAYIANWWRREAVSEKISS